MARIPVRLPRDPNDFRAGNLFFDTDSNKLIIYSDATFQDIAEKLPEGWVNVKNFGAKGDGITDDTEAILQAINNAHNTKKALYFPPGIYILSDSINIPDGIAIFGAGAPAIYGITFPSSHSFSVIKQTASNKPAFVLGSYSSIQNIGFYYAGDGPVNGIIQFKDKGQNRTSFANKLINISIAGKRIATSSDDIWNGNAVVGIKFVNENNGVLYFNTLENIHIGFCDVGIWTCKETNANIFSNISIITAYRYIIIDGETGVSIENTFSNLALFLMGSNSFTSVIFTLRNAHKNTFFSFATETVGDRFDVDNASSGNLFYGSFDEPYYTLPGEKNIFNDVRTSYLLTSLQDNKLNLKRTFKFVSTYTYPNEIKANNNTGTLIENDPSSKKLIKLNFPGRGALVIRLNIYVDGPYEKDPTLVDGKIYVYTNSDGSIQHIVSDITKLGSNTITGLHYIKGGYIAITCGNYGNYNINTLKASWDVDMFLYAHTVTNLSPSIIFENITADDVRNSVNVINSGTYTL